MKKAIIAVAAILCVVAFCVGFYFLQSWSDREQQKDEELTEFQKIISKDLENDYPVTPREVVKLHNRIVLCFYSGSYSQEELGQLADQELELLDEELRDNNPKEEYLANLQLDIENYKKNKKSISQTDVCDTNDVLYKKIDGDDIAYVTAYYFMKEDGSFNKTYQQFVLRKDEEGKWKILVFYQIEGPSSEDD